MSEESLREFFADVRSDLNINLGQWCDRNMIYRSDFSNFMKGKKFYTSLGQLDQMRRDIIHTLDRELTYYKKIG